MGAVPMSDLPRKSERVSGLEVWAFALATTLVALIAVGVVPHGLVRAKTYDHNHHDLE